MKITDPDVIKNGEKDLIDSIKEDLDHDAIKEILKNQIAQTVLSAKGGQIIVHDNQIAFRMDFDLNLSGSLIFDRDGNYIPQTDDLLIPDVNDPALSDTIDLDDVSINDAFEDLDPVSELRPVDKKTLTEGDEPVSSDLMDGLSEEDLDLDLAEDEDGSPDILDDLLDDEIDEPLGESDVIETLESDLEPDALIDDNAQHASDEDNMDGILQENREFWEQKKDS